MEKKEDLEIKKASESLTAQDLEKVAGGTPRCQDIGNCSKDCSSD